MVTRTIKVLMTIMAGLLMIQLWYRNTGEPKIHEPLFRINLSHSYDRLSPSNGSLSTSSLFASNENATSSISSHHNYDICNVTVSILPCPPVPPNLQGRQPVRKSAISADEVWQLLIEKKGIILEPGGIFKVQDCIAKWNVALIVPYRNRKEHLTLFLLNIHTILPRQQINYQVFIIEQSGSGPFNRGKLMNVGFVEANLFGNFDCYIFHDVDLLIEDDRNLYTCPTDQPRHMSVAVDKFNYKLPYQDLFGGVSALTRQQFEKVNGFGNNFWGWGGEDDDMSYRVRKSGMHISRYPPTLARYTMLRHTKSPPNRDRYKVMQRGRRTYLADGLNSLKYDRENIDLQPLYTRILVDIEINKKS